MRRRCLAGCEPKGADLVDNAKFYAYPYKPAIKSKAIAGGAVGILSGAVMALEGYASGDTSQLGAGIAAVIGGVLAIYGRIKARRQISGIA